MIDFVMAVYPWCVIFNAVVLSCVYVLVTTRTVFVRFNPIMFLATVLSGPIGSILIMITILASLVNA